QIIDLVVAIFLALLLTALLLFRRNRVGAFVAIDPVVHQRVAGVEDTFDRIDTVAILALRDVIAREQHVVDDRIGIGPGAEQIIALEKRIVAVAGVRDHQRLHHHRVLLHEIGDAGVGVDDDFVGEAHLAATVIVFNAEEMFAERPVVVIHRHAGGRVSIHHLFGADDFDLIRIGVELIFFGNGLDGAFVLLDQIEGPLRAGGNRLAFAFVFLGFGSLCAHHAVLR